MPDHWQEVGKCLSGTRLSDSNEVPTAHGCWNCLTLDRRGLHEFLVLDNFKDRPRQATLVPRTYWSWTLDPSDFDVAIGLSELSYLFVCHVR